MEQRKSPKTANVRVMAIALLACVASLEGAALAQSPPPISLPDGSKTEEGATNQDGKWVLPDGTPTYHVSADGTVDWYSYSGFRRYHDAGGCTQCHGPDGAGSTYAPALVESLKTIPYSAFVEVVTNGRERPGSVMPPFAGNNNVMCYIDDIYIYLKARSDGVLPRGRPPGRDEKPQAAKDHDKACFGR
jgi:methanol metabolism-related c-type cytochrome